MTTIYILSFHIIFLLAFNHLVYVYVSIIVHCTVRAAERLFFDLSVGDQQERQNESRAATKKEGIYRESNL